MVMDTRRFGRRIFSRSPLKILCMHQLTIVLSSFFLAANIALTIINYHQKKYKSAIVSSVCATLMACILFHELHP
jgi:preprotein translocase subunit SecG